MHMHHDVDTILRLMCDLIVITYKLILGNLIEIIPSSVAVLIVMLLMYHINYCFQHYPKDNYSDERE